MVQLTAAEQGDVAPPLGYVPSYLVPGHELPHSALGPQSCGGVDSSQPPLFPECSSQLTCDPASPDSHVTHSFLTPDPCLALDVVHSSTHSPSFISLSSMDSIPVTVLASGVVPGDCPCARLAGESSSDGGRTFEVILVSEGGQYGGMDNAHADPSLCVDSGLQEDTRVDSVDSLLESRGYSSDSSDVYMNSDYTDTVTSADSGTFLLSAKKLDHRNSDSSETDCSESSTLVPNFYSNEAFNTESRKELLAWPAEDSSREGQEARGREERREWSLLSIGEEVSGALADREDEEGERTELMARTQADTLETLVTQLAEQHPQEVVAIRIEVLDQPGYPALTQPVYPSLTQPVYPALSLPMYPPLTEPLEGEEEASWLQSTDSLHRYKLLKQGRSCTLSNMRLHALSSLRANTMTNLHERSSFLNLTASSVTSLGHACQKALSYVRADMEFGSMMSLGHNPFPSSLPPGKEDCLQDGGLSGAKKGGQATVASGCHTRNVLYMALLVTILLIAVNTTRNLQSSLNQEGGVGIVCLAAMFASYTLGSLLSPLLVQGRGVKACVVLGLLLQLLYVAANLHPLLWLMLPASLGGGASLALIWNAMSTYLVLLARGESDYRHKSYQRVSDKYFGIFCLIYQSNLIIGNLIASLVLTFAGGDDGSVPVPINGTGRETLAAINGTATETLAAINGTMATQVMSSNLSSVDPAPAALSPTHLLTDFAGTLGGGNGTDSNSTSLLPGFDASSQSHYHLCGAVYCHHFVLGQESAAVPERTVYLLFGIFLLLVVGAILMAIFLLEPLSPRPFPPSSSSSSAWHTLRGQLLSLVKFSRNAKFLLILPLLLYSTMQFSFVCSEVMMAYVTCPVGVWLVGYTMIGYGVSCSLGSYLTQALVPRIGRGFFISLATCINLGVLVFMRLWQPHPDSLLPLFAITALMGLTDGIWNVNANGLCGSMFPEHYEEAFTGLRIAQGLGGAVSMASAPVFCMAVKIYVMMAGALTVCLGYLAAEVLIRRESRHSGLLFEKHVV